MYSTFPTLNNKKITAMFYVHLFLKAMYKERKKKNQLCISKICLHIRLAVEVLKLQKAIASYVKQVEQTQRGRKHRHNSNTATVTEINSERERLTGSMLESILVNIARTTARKLIYRLKWFPWMSANCILKGPMHTHNLPNIYWM